MQIVGANGGIGLDESGGDGRVVGFNGDVAGLIGRGGGGSNNSTGDLLGQMVGDTAALEILVAMLSLLVKAAAGETMVLMLMILPTEEAAIGELLVLILVSVSVKWVAGDEWRVVGSARNGGFVDGDRPIRISGRVVVRCGSSNR